MILKRQISLLKCSTLTFIFHLKEAVLRDAVSLFLYDAFSLARKFDAQGKEHGVTDADKNEMQRLTEKIAAKKAELESFV